MPICEKCGNPLPEGERFCPACGVVSDPHHHPGPHESAPRPPKGSPFAPVGSWTYVGSLLLMSLPAVGFIISIVWAFGGIRNKNLCNLARAILLLDAIAVVIALIGFLVFGWNLSTVSEIVSY